MNTKAPPNFLIICLDQIGAQTLFDNPELPMPNLDRLASEGCRFERGYCNNPVCMPSRATLITGLTPRQHGCVTNGVPLPEDVPTVTECLRQNGYRTFSAGKLHLQPGLDAGKRGALPSHSWEDKVLWESGDIEHLPEGYYGFDETAYISGHVSGCYGDYVNELKSSAPEILEAYRRQGECPADSNAICWKTDVPAEMHYNHWIADKTIAFMDAQSAAQPFFAWCSFPDPHGPWAAAREYADLFDPDELTLNPTWQENSDPLPILEKYRSALPPFLKAEKKDALAEVTAQVYGMCRHIDDNIGRILEALEQNGKRDNTVIALVADHGEYLGSHGLLGKTIWPWENLLRIPMLWSLPEMRSDGPTSIELPVSTLDVVPTILELAGIEEERMFDRGKVRAELRLPGDSLVPWLRGEDRPLERDVLVEFDNNMKPGTPIQMRSLVNQKYKLTIYAGEPDGLLYDLDADPLERNNLWHDLQYREKRSELLEKLLHRIVESGPHHLPRHIGA